MTTEQKLWELVNKLLDQTEKGSRTWEKTPENSVFQTDFPNFTLRITEVSAYEYVISIYDEKGTLIEAASNSTISRTIKDQAVHPILQRLYTEARRRALGVDKALDSLLSSIDNLPAP